MGGFGLLGGGLDVRGLVDQILFAESAPIRRVEEKQDKVNLKIQAYTDLVSKLTELEGKIAALNDTEKFAAKLATSSNSDVFTVAADSNALNGTHQITVSRLALLDNFASDATFTTSNDVIGTGSFDLTVGSETTTITIDPTNSTLTGLRDAINDSGAEVNANIINDGSGFRLTITSKDTGSQNAISIDNNTLQLAGGSPFTFARTHENLLLVSDLDAELKIDGLLVTSGSNKVEGVIEGVTINLLGISSGPLTLTIADDTDTVKESIQEFVNAYNDAYSFVNSQFLYIEDVGSGTLAGESLVRSIQSDLSTIVRNAVSGLPGPLNNLQFAGVEIQGDGTLQIDDSRLDDKLENNFLDVKKMFLAFAETSNSSLTFLGVGPETLAGDYEVTISQLAEAATLTSPHSISTTLQTDETLTFSLGSENSVVSLTSNMTIDDVVSAINTQLDTDSIALTASKDGSDNLVITADNKGASTSFTVVSDIASPIPGQGTGFDTTGSSDAGEDLMGTIKDTVSGMVYAAKATADNVLVGDDGPVKGLRVQFDGSSTGVIGTLTLTLGYAEQLQRELEGLTDTVTGPISDTKTRLEERVESLEDDIESLEGRLLVRERFLLEQFAQADAALRQLSVLQSTINSQITQVL